MYTGSDDNMGSELKKDLSVLMFTGLYPPAYRGGGPIRTVSAIAKTHSGTTDFRIITSDRDWGKAGQLDVDPDCWTERDEARVWYARDDSLFSLLRGISSARKASPDFVYLNSFFSLRHSIIPAVLFRCGYFGAAKLIVAPRGEFGSAARIYKPIRKKLLLKFLQVVRWHKDTIWHASSSSESADIYRTFPNSKVIVRINESTLPSRALRRKTAEVDRVRLIYVSRVTEIKGLLTLLEALKGIDNRVLLEIYGPSDDKVYLEACRNAADALPDHIQVLFNDAVENSEVRGLFGKSDAFFLPTEQENFGHAIAESLSAGCPVYVADVTPWSDVIRNGGGAIVPSHRVEDWQKTLAEFCALSWESRHARKLAAADAYEEWRASQHGPSIFELAAQT